MNYTFQFGVALDRLPDLLPGALLTLELFIVSFWGGALLSWVSWQVSASRSRPMSTTTSSPKRFRSSTLRRR